MPWILSTHFTVLCGKKHIYLAVDISLIIKNLNTWKVSIGNFTFSIEYAAFRSTYISSWFCYYFFTFISDMFIGYA